VAGQFNTRFARPRRLSPVLNKSAGPERESRVSLTTRRQLAGGWFFNTSDKLWEGVFAHFSHLSRLAPDGTLTQCRRLRVKLDLLTNPPFITSIASKHCDFQDTLLRQ